MLLKNHVNRICSLVGILLLLGFSGCARYSAHPIKKYSSLAHDSRTNREQSISLSYCLFDEADCKRYLDRDVLRQGYQPVLITLMNNSNQSFYTSYDSISLPCIPPQAVARSVHTSTKARVLGYGLPGLVAWPLLIPAVFDGIGSSEANEYLDQDFDNKALEEMQLISPYSTVSGLIFVDFRSFDEEFTVTVTNSLTLNRTELAPKKPHILSAS